jgi:hypothetical protein
VGIKTPMEAKDIEILQEQTQEVELVTQNFQYVCANFANCMTVGCLNGGIYLSLKKLKLIRMQ